MDDLGNYSVSIEPLDGYIGLKNEWLNLEEKSNCSFFLSWTWISTWLSAFKPTCFVLKVKDISDQKIAGLALLTRSKSTKWNHFPSSRVHMHQTGDPVCDQIWTEYNGLLVKESNKLLVFSAAMHYLKTNFPSWDELVVGAITKDDAVLIEQSTGLERHELWEAPAYGVDLTKIANSQSAYLSSLSSNSRYQIRRSLKRYESQSGALTLHPAQSLTEALSYLHATAPFHLERWGSTVNQSGFANPSFVKFHQTLINNAWHQHQIDFIKLTSGKRVLGYFYNFLYRGTVYFYLSGLCSEKDSKLKPGLSGHTLCIQNYANKGFSYYDFMGGNERYKASLGKQGDELFKVSFQKQKLKFKIENVIRKLKQSIQG